MGGEWERYSKRESDCKKETERRLVVREWKKQRELYKEKRKGEECVASVYL